jgi:uncharacterized RDD family membrane protein YckC
MGCPQCQSDEISPAGVCLICGYQTTAEPDEHAEGETESVSEEAPVYSGMIEMDYSEGTPAAPEKIEVPEWRQQLSQRLHEIKQRRESGSTAEDEGKSKPSAASQASAAESVSALQAKLARKTLPRKPKLPPVPQPQQKILRPVASPPGPESEPPAAPPTDPQEIRNLIDNAISLQTVPAGPPPTAYYPPSPEPQMEENGEDKLILLTRTLSGLVDLIVVLVCTGLFIFVADYFSGIVALDNFSLVLFFLVFLLNYFVYSLFFLSASNQTIGMMITELRVVGMNAGRPSEKQILKRCLSFLVSLFGLGIGLLTGIFDRGSRCFHDRISGTHVERI